MNEENQKKIIDILLHNDENKGDLPKIANKTNSLNVAQRQPLKKRQLLKKRDLSTSKTELIENIEEGLEDLTADIELPKLLDTAPLPKFYETVVLPKFKEEIENKTIQIETLDVDIPGSLEVEEPKISVNRETKLNKYLLRFALVLSIFGILYSGINIVLWHRDNVSLEKEMAELDDIIEESIVERPFTLPEEPPVESGEQPNETEPPSPKPDYSRLSLVDVDFSKLKAINPDTRAFLKINNLDVSIPVVQTTDNSFYLKHSFDKKWNSAGWIFGDYRNDWDNLKTNTIIYGHNRTTNVLFGSLKLMYNKTWYENKDNHIIYLSTENKSMLFEIFSVYDIPTETYYLANEFGSEKVYQEYLDTITRRSAIPFETKPTTSDKLLTLSTCRTSTTKTVVHARLIAQQDKSNTSS